jgi:quinol monooxygenase YgiN
MSDQPVVVFATFVPAEGRADAVATILRRMRTATREEPGNEQYDLFRSERDGRTTFHLIERYTDGEALQAHRDSDHYRAYRAEIPDLLAEPIGVLVLTEVD